ncbi:hypothetical protein O3P69_004470 [Scylla paramamosain]|uniref:Nephrin n=1 Tax=Scylla paramamosain TaxID=85552 RepID=A0AAW0UCB3_SCYPA
MSPPTTRLLLLALPSLLGWGAAGRQRFRQRPESVEVVEGEDVLLRCEVEEQEGRAQWTKDGFALGFEREVPGYPRFSYLGRPALGQHHLLISGVTTTEDGEYQCQVGPGSSNRPIWAAANVTVLVAPRSVEILGRSDGEEVVVAEGGSLTLDCVVKDARPAPTATWLRDGAPIPPGLVEETVEKSSLPRRWNVRSSLVLRVTAEDDGRLFSCEAAHPAIRGDTAPPLASVTLSVLHPPGRLSISGYREDEVLVAGQRVTLLCQAEGGNPRPALTWRRRPRALPRASSTPSVVTLTATSTTTTATITTSRLQLTAAAEDDRAEYECRAESDLLQRPLVASMTLTVYYAPSSVSVSGPRQVTLGEVVSLTCETSESNPPAVLTWRVDGEEVRATREIMSEVSTGGWATSSELIHRVPDSTPATQVTVECLVVNPAVTRPRSKTVFISITKPAGPPIFEGNPGRDVLAGTTIDVICLSHGGHPAPNMRLYKVNQPITTIVTRKGNVTRAKAQLQVIPSDNGSEVTCEVTSSAAGRPMTASFAMSVLFPPWEVNGWVSPPSVEEGKSLTLSCLSSPSLPPSNVTWRSRWITLESAQVTHSPAAFGGFSTESEVVVVRAAASHNGRPVVCEATNGLASPVSTSLTLHVLHAPLWVSKPPTRINVTEGSDLLVKAAAMANPGPIRYLWRRVKSERDTNTVGNEDSEEDEETLIDQGKPGYSGSEGEMRIRRVSRKDAGHYSVKVTSPRGTSSAPFYVNVQYGPEEVAAEERREVAAGEEVRLKCSSRGNPSPHLTWTRNAKPPPRLVGGLAFGEGVAWLTVEAASMKDTGVYFCHARSPLGSATPRATRLVVQQPATVVPDVGVSSKPTDKDEFHASWAEVGGTGRLVCRVRAAPPPTFVWSSSSDLILLNSDKYTIHEPQLTDGLVTWASVLEVTKIRHQDYTSYRCTAHNALGSDSVLVHLRPPSRPLPPLHLIVANVTGEEVWLTWTPNLGGGSPRGYTVRYRPVNESEYEHLEVAGGMTSVVRIEGLDPGRQYTVGVQAVSPHGRSHFVSRAMLTWPGRDTEPPTSFQGLAGGSAAVAGGRGGAAGVDGGGQGGSTPSRLPRFMLLLLTLTGAALLLLNISIITCFVRRRAAAAAAAAADAAAAVSASTKSSPTPGVKDGGSPSAVPGTLPYLPLLPLTALSPGGQLQSPTLDQVDKLVLCGNGGLVPPPAAAAAAVPTTTTITTTQLSPRNGGVITTSSTFIALRTTPPRTSSWGGGSDGSTHQLSAVSNTSAETNFGVPASITAAFSAGSPKISRSPHLTVSLPQGPDVCLVTPSTYEDISGRLSSLHPPSEDQLSISSCRSSTIENSSVCSSQGLFRPLSSLRNLEYLQEAPEIVQDAVRSLPRPQHATSRSSSPGKDHCGLEDSQSTEYSSLSPSGLLLSGSHFPRSPCSLVSFTGGAGRQHTYTPLAPRRLTPIKIPCPRPPSRSPDGAAGQQDHFESPTASTTSSLCDQDRTSHKLMTATKNKHVSEASTSSDLSNASTCDTSAKLKINCSSNTVRSPVSEQSFQLPVNNPCDSPGLLQPLPSSSLTLSQQQEAQHDQARADDPLQEFSGSSGYNSSSPDQDMTRDPRNDVLWSEKTAEGEDDPSKREPETGEQ